VPTSVSHRLLAVVVSALFGLLAPGCRVNIEEPSTIPSATELYFPAGLVKDPELPLLYISNGNSDLRYGGGTLQVADLARFDCALSAARGRPVDPLLCPTATADAATCAADVLDPLVLNCPASTFLFSEATVKLGNFAGAMALQRRDNPSDATDRGRRRLFVAVRGDPSITWIDVDTRLATGTGRGLLDCFNDETESRLAGGLPLDDKTGLPSPVSCDLEHLVQQNLCVGQTGCVPGSPASNQVIPSEPFALSYDEGARADGTTFRRLVVSHLSPGQVTVLDASSTPFVSTVSAPLFSPDGAGRRGAFSIAPRQAGVENSLFYATTTTAPRLQTFRIDSRDGVVPADPVTLTGLFAANSDYRQLAFEPGGNRAFLTLGAPPSLLVLDTRVRPELGSPSLPVNQPIDAVSVCPGPSNVVLRPTVDPATGEARSRLFVVCFQTGQVMEVDPDHPRVLETITVGRGPNQLVFDDGGRRPRAYVAHFLESTIGVIDLEPGSPTERRLVARLGLPIPPPANP
jgi:hypothetical protein